MQWGHLEMEVRAHVPTFCDNGRFNYLPDA